jgi:Tetracyclin repressor-like, C-terminal domain
MMRAVMRGYGLTNLDETHAVRLLGSVFHGYASLESAGAFSHSTSDGEDSWSRILEVLDSMLTNWPQGWSVSAIAESHCLVDHRADCRTCGVGALMVSS